MKEHQLNDKFTLSTDKLNWILTEKLSGKKVKRSYFSNFGQLSRFLGDRAARDCSDKLTGSLEEISTITPSYTSEIDKFSKALELYLTSIIEDDKSRFNK